MTERLTGVLLCVLCLVSCVLTLCSDPDSDDNNASYCLAVSIWHCWLRLSVAAAPPPVRYAFNLPFYSVLLAMFVASAKKRAPSDRVVHVLVAETLKVRGTD